MAVRTPSWRFAGTALILLAAWAVLWFIHPWLFGLGLLGAMTAAAALWWRRTTDEKTASTSPLAIHSVLKAGPAPAPAAPQHVEPANADDLVSQMLCEGRYALLLRPQIAANLPADQAQCALAELDQRMALVPDGDVVMRATRFEGNDDDDASLERLVRVESLFLDRYPVTNAQYKAFVDAGGYEQISLWDPTVWPAILDFVDSTGHSGPRFWKDGHYPAGEEHFPVVGVSWYEASAYARWVGKRLPSDPEWVKAGAWPVQVPGGKPLQRKHPWGDTMDRALANLWGSGPGKVVPVHEYHNGGTVGGVYQLIGNTWEWTTSNYGAWDPALRRLEMPTQMKSIRGGAFDTYFDSQANCQFQSGDSPMARKHNIGFRCALGVCDLGDIQQRTENTGDDSQEATVDEGLALEAV